MTERQECFTEDFEEFLISRILWIDTEKLSPKNNRVRANLDAVLTKIETQLDSQACIEVESTTNALVFSATETAYIAGLFDGVNLNHTFEIKGGQNYAIENGYSLCSTRIDKTPAKGRVSRPR